MHFCIGPISHIVQSKGQPVRCIGPGMGGHDVQVKKSRNLPLGRTGSGSGFNLFLPNAMARRLTGAIFVNYMKILIRDKSLS